ncbi:MAG: hypothetical protein U0835_15750 [Isosphaeraceae bacterium]
MIDQIHPAESTFADRAEELKASALEIAHTMGGQLATVNRRVQAAVNQDPVRALGVAFGAGLLLGWFIKRR